MFDSKPMDYVDKSRCPICDIKMRNIGEKNICPDCGYTYRLYGTVSGALNKSSSTLKDVNAQHNNSKNVAEVWSDVHDESSHKQKAKDILKRGADALNKDVKTKGKPSPFKIIALLIAISFLLNLVGTVIFAVGEAVSDASDAIESIFDLDE